MTDETADKPKIAIVEDDPAIAQMYRMKFESEGFVVEAAADGAAGLELIQRFKPNIVLLDLMMPVMTGDQMLTEMRKQPWGSMDVIILTNMGESEVPATVREMGVKDFIVKADMTPRQVAERVKQVLGKPAAAKKTAKPEPEAPTSEQNPTPS